MISMILLGVAALLINVFFYFKELANIMAAFLGFAHKRSAKSFVPLAEETRRFLMDVSLSAIVILLAGAGLYSFMIGSVGSAVVSIILWRKEIFSYCKNALTFDHTVQTVLT